MLGEGRIHLSHFDIFRFSLIWDENCDQNHSVYITEEIADLTFIPFDWCGFSLISGSETFPRIIYICSFMIKCL